MSFIEINVVGLSTTIRLGIVVAGLIVPTTSCRQCKLVLILKVVPGKVSWLTTLVAQTIIGGRSRSWEWCSCVSASSAP